ncbi:MAG: transglycosylase domain-containing protein [Bacilli bacterium]
MAQKKETIKGKNKSIGKKVISRSNTPSNKRSVKKETREIKTIKNKQMDPKTMEIIAALFVLLLIISFFTMGLGITIILALGIGGIIAISKFLKKATNNTKKRTILNKVAIACLVIGIIGAITVSGFLIYVVKTAPDFDPVQLNNKQSSVLFDINNNEYAKLGTELRENIKYDDLPQVFIDALIATEDSRFFQHNGFDAPRFIKASLKQVVGSDGAGGASTLSMQVIKNSFTGIESSGIKGILRKFTDIYLAVFKLEKNYTKEQIIEFYINNHNLGGTIFGVEEASQAYFGKSVKYLTLPEASLLAGMFKAPTSYNPAINPDNARDRRSTVLNLMVRHGYISEEEAKAAKAIPVDSLVADGASKLNFEHQAYIDTVMVELKEKYKINYTNTPVLIYTNMDTAKQTGINDIFSGKTYNWLNADVQSGVAVTDINTGKILAIGAGRNRTGARTYNLATMAVRQIGSTAKPIFDYGPGLEYNNWSTYQQFIDEPWNYTNGPSVNNSDLKFMGQISMRTALSMSRNIPALKAFQNTDNKKILEFAKNLGMNPEVSSGRIHEAHSLGAYKGATPLDMAAAYGAFGNGGYYIEPYAISKIVYRDTGKEIIAKPEKKQVMSDSTAFMINDILKTAVNSGLSSGARINGVNLAAKTGTTSFDDATKDKWSLPDNAINDAWVVGYNPDIALSLWYGYDKTDSTHYSNNIQAVVQRGKLYQAIGKIVFPKDKKDFAVPNSVVKSAVEIGSNPALLPSDATPADQITYEYFKAGTEPTEISTRYKKLSSVTSPTAEYDEDSKKVTIRWTGIPIPGGNASYGEFGYNIYFNDTLLGFTTESKYSFETSSPSGTYKIISTFKNYHDNQSKPVLVTIKEDKPIIESNYTTTLKGQQFNTITVGEKYKDPSPPVTIIEDKTKTDITKEVMQTSGIEITIKNGDGTIVTDIDNTKPGVFTITYKIKYQGYSKSLTRTVTVKDK